MESLGERLYVFKRFLMHYAMPHSFLDLGVQESLSKPFLVSHVGEKSAFFLFSFQDFDDSNNSNMQKVVL